MSSKRRSIIPFPKTSLNNWLSGWYSGEHIGDSSGIPIYPYRDICQYFYFFTGVITRLAAASSWPIFVVFRLVTKLSYKFFMLWRFLDNWKQPFVHFWSINGRKDYGKSLMYWVDSTVKYVISPHLRACDFLPPSYSLWLLTSQTQCAYCTQVGKVEEIKAFL